MRKNKKMNNNNDNYDYDGLGPRHKDARWFNFLNVVPAFDEERWKEFTKRGYAFFFGDKITKDYVEETISWELKRFAMRAERETEPSVRFFRQTLNSYTIWMELMNSNINHGSTQQLTTVLSIIDKYQISRNTIKRILEQAIEAGWATEYQPTETCPYVHYEATEVTMVEYFKRVKREATLFNKNFQHTSIAFHKLLEFEDYIKEKAHIR